MAHGMGDWSWLAIIALGAYHGLNPAMGWLFAVSLGLQEGNSAKVVEALFPIAAGHLVSITLIVALIGWAEWAINPRTLAVGGGGALIAFGVFRFFSSRFHYRWVGMRVSRRDLVLWSFLMASAHGAGLMLFPILINMPVLGSGGRLTTAHASAAALIETGAAVVVVHTAAMLLVAGAIAIAVYRWLGLAILRSAWINMDKIWAATLAACGLIVILV